MNGHPSLLPRYRGPTPVSWAIRNGETEIGFTFHRMDPELDTGAILAQARFELADENSWDELGPKIEAAAHDLFPASSSASSVATRANRRRRTDGSYFTFFEPEYAWIDWSGPAAEIERQVRAWRFHSAASRVTKERSPSSTARRSASSVSASSRQRPRQETGDGTCWISETEPA